MTLFEKIIARDIPADIVYEDDLCLAFKDVNPEAPHHLLIIPKEAIVSINELKPCHKKLAGHLLLIAQHIAKDILKIDSQGYRLVINTGQDGGQSVFHLHIHLLAGRELTWPPG